MTQDTDNLAEVTQAIINGRLALINWQKYNGEQADEVVYQAEKLATALQAFIAALSHPSPTNDGEVERHGEALHALSAIMLKRGLFPEKGNDLTEAYEAVVLTWAALVTDGGENVAG